MEEKEEFTIRCEKKEKAVWLAQMEREQRKSLNNFIVYAVNQYVISCSIGSPI